MTAQAIGGIAGGLLAGRVITRYPSWLVIGVTLTAFGAIDLVIFNYPRWFDGIWPVLALFVLVGVPGGIGFASRLTIIQTAVADEYRGRVFAVAGVLIAAGVLVGAILGGTLAGDVGVVNLLTIQGAGYVVAGVCAGVLLRRGEQSVAVVAPQAAAAESGSD